MAETIPDSTARTETKTLTAEEISSLYEVGELMCTDMIEAAAVADAIAYIGMETLIDPAQRVTHQTTTEWVSIAEEYAQALEAIEAGTL